MSDELREAATMALRSLTLSADQFAKVYGEDALADEDAVPNALRAALAATPAPLDGLREALDAALPPCHLPVGRNSDWGVCAVHGEVFSDDRCEDWDRGVRDWLYALAATPAPLDVERPHYTAYVDGRMCHNCGLEPYRHECPALAAEAPERPA